MSWEEVFIVAFARHFLLGRKKAISSGERNVGKKIRLLISLFVCHFPFFSFLKGDLDDRKKIKSLETQLNGKRRFGESLNRNFGNFFSFLSLPVTRESAISFSKCDDQR